VDGDINQAQYHGHQSRGLGRTVAIFIRVRCTQKRVQHGWNSPHPPMIIFIADAVGCASGAT
jgi:hypothetical protein